MSILLNEIVELAEKLTSEERAELIERLKALIEDSNQNGDEK